MQAQLSCPTYISTSIHPPRSPYGTSISTPTTFHDASNITSLNPLHQLRINHANRRFSPPPRFDILRLQSQQAPRGKAPNSRSFPPKSTTNLPSLPVQKCSQHPPKAPLPHPSNRLLPQRLLRCPSSSSLPPLFSLPPPLSNHLPPNRSIPATLATTPSQPSYPTAFSTFPPPAATTSAPHLPPVRA